MYLFHDLGGTPNSILQGTEVVFPMETGVLCMIGYEFLNILFMKLVLQMLIESSTGYCSCL